MKTDIKRPPWSERFQAVDRVQAPPSRFKLMQHVHRRGIQVVIRCVLCRSHHMNIYILVTGLARHSSLISHQWGICALVITADWNVFAHCTIPGQLSTFLQRGLPECILKVIHGLFWALFIRESFLHQSFELTETNTWYLGSSEVWSHAHLLLCTGLQVSQGASVSWRPWTRSRCSPTLSHRTLYAGRDGWVSHLWFIVQPNKSGQR